MQNPPLLEDRNSKMARHARGRTGQSQTEKVVWRSLTQVGMAASPRTMLDSLRPQALCFAPLRGLSR